MSASKTQPPSKFSPTTGTHFITSRIAEKLRKKMWPPLRFQHRPYNTANDNNQCRPNSTYFDFSAFVCTVCYTTSCPTSWQPIKV